jgi:hypothetical protein
MMNNSLKLCLLLCFFSCLIHSQESENNLPQENPKTSDSTDVLRMPPPPPQNPTLIFSYDAAGNQSQRFYCDDGLSCTVPTPPTQNNRSTILAESDVILSNLENETSLEKTISVFPNPTESSITISLEESISNKGELYVYDILGSTVLNIPLQIKERSFNVDMSNLTSGVYFVHLHIDGSSVTKKIIKK